MPMYKKCIRCLLFTRPRRISHALLFFLFAHHVRPAACYQLRSLSFAARSICPARFCNASFINSPLIRACCLSFFSSTDVVFPKPYINHITSQKFRLSLQHHHIMVGTLRLCEVPRCLCISASFAKEGCSYLCEQLS